MYETLNNLMEFKLFNFLIINLIKMVYILVEFEVFKRKFLLSKTKDLYTFSENYERIFKYLKTYNDMQNYFIELWFVNYYKEDNTVQEE